MKKHRRQARLSPSWETKPCALTPPSRGRPAGGPPLTSNVRQHQKCLHVVVESCCSRSRLRGKRPCRSAWRAENSQAFVKRTVLARSPLPLWRWSARSSGVKMQEASAAQQLACCLVPKRNKPSGAFVPPSRTCTAAPLCWWRCVPGISLLSLIRLTPRSKGRLAASRKPPLTSNVRPSAGRSPTQLKRRLPMSVFQGLSRDAFCHRERRARFSVGLGCPSFGGQREVGGRFNLPPAKSVNKLKPWRHVASHQCLRSRPELEVGAATGLVLPPWQADQTEIATASVLHSPANGGRVASPVPLGSACLARQLHHGWCISGA